MIKSIDDLKSKGLELGNIYQADCLEVMKLLKDKSVDLVIVDMPYGMEYKSNRYKNENPFQSIIGDDKYPAHLLVEFKRLSKKAVFSFCRWDNLYEIEKPKSFIVWAKNNWTAGDLEHEYGRMWEGICFYPMENHKFEIRQPDIIDYRKIPSTDFVHPTQKPVGLMEYLIENNTEENDIVADFMCGSGTTCVAAEKLGRRWLGCDISEKYCQIARERIERERAQLKFC